MDDPQQNQVKLLEEQKNILEENAKLLVRRDMDLRKSNEELEQEKQTIAAERNKLSIILSGISDAVIALDLEGKITTFNKAAEKITGLTAQQVLNQPISVVIKIFDKEVEIPQTTYAPILKDQFEGILFNKQEVRIVSTAGKETTGNIITGQIKEGISANLGCIVTIHDLTEEKMLEKMKLDFVAMAAHELRTPLTSIKGYLSVFIQENKQQFNADQNMLISKASDATNQLGALIENLLNISQIERNTMTVASEPADWVAVARQTTNEFMMRAVEKKIALKFVEPTQPIPPIKIDKLRVNEVLSNLLANAIMFTAPGGEVQVVIKQENNTVITQVIDTGKGIPAEALPHLFTKFFRVSGVLEDYSKGTGLGLYISKSIIDLHHGKIWVESQLGKGSTFNFSLPLA